MKKIEIQIECQSCKGTGLYSGFAENKGVAVVCNKCDGTGSYFYTCSYNDFTGRKPKKGIKRVYLSGMGYEIGLGKINFSNGIGIIDMDKEGISYTEFMSGKKPEHIKKLGCPMLADQSACHNKKGFTDECNRLNGSRITKITNCKKYPDKKECWVRLAAHGLTG